MVPAHEVSISDGWPSVPRDIARHIKRRSPGSHRESVSSWPVNHHRAMSGEWGSVESWASHWWPPNHSMQISVEWNLPGRGGVPHDISVLQSWNAGHDVHTSTLFEPHPNPALSRILMKPAAHGQWHSKTWRHELAVSELAWPPNHLDVLSKSWTRAHEMNTSVFWGANHAVSASATWPKGHEMSWPVNHDGAVSDGWSLRSNQDPVEWFPKGHSIWVSASEYATLDANRGEPAGAITFNQHFIEQRLGGDAAVVAKEHASDITEGVSFDNPVSIVLHVLDNLPAKVRVLPSERYYYYRFPLGERRVSGNLRFTSAEEGLLHVGYFDMHDQSSMGTMTLGADDGCRVSELSDGVYEVAFRGRRVVFELALEFLEVPDDLKLEEDERAVTALLDESGYRFVLIWNETHECLYYILPPDGFVPDELVPFGPEEHHTLVGRKSRFVFYNDVETDRRLLIGVWQRHIMDNSYFDGPFDQVPPHLPLRPMLERAYPYVKWKGGINEHGVFIERPGQRVAITPYTVYQKLEGVTAMVADAMAQENAGEALWSALTYDSKRDFHERWKGNGGTIGSVLGDGSHVQYMSQGWPANHRGDSSRAWPSEHAASVSKDWPANHESALSTAQPVATQK